MAIRAVGLLLIALSIFVLTITFRGLWNAQRYLEQEYGINEPLRLGRARFIIWACAAALILGFALAILS